MEYSVLAIYSDIQNLVETQIGLCADALGISRKSYYVVLEQAYTLEQENRVYKEDVAYFVLSFGSGTVLINKGVVQPFFIDVNCTDSRADQLKALLGYFGQNYTFVAPVFSDDYEHSNAMINQAYSMPNELEKFVEYGVNRGVHLQVQGTITYGPNVLGYQKIEILTNPEHGSEEEDEWVEIQATSFSFTYNMTPSSANLGNKNDFVTSEAKFGTIGFTFSSVPNSTLDFYKDAIFYIPLKRTTSINKEYTFKFTFTDDDFATVNVKIISCEYGKEIGSLPQVVIGVTEGS